jgi:hypothetical protein
MTIDGGPAALMVPAVNTAYISVEVCVHGTNTCQTVDHIEIDTGSVGLRIISSVLTVALTPEMDAGNNPLAECLQFADGTAWGSLAVADITLPVSTETTVGSPNAPNGVNVQLIGDASVGNPQASCTVTPENTVDSFGANGILGVGPFNNDCNSIGDCAPGAQAANYYSCPTSTTCAGYSATLAQQVQNPVTLFANDNNGVILELASIGAGGADGPSGSLVFGIGTQSNNALGNATQVGADPSTGVISATLNGTVYPYSYLDSGSNGNFFTDSSLTPCANPKGFYCSNKNESATLQSPTAGTMLAADFSVEDADTLFGSNPSGTAFNNLAGTNPDPNAVDLGLPFFFGRNVFTGFENPATGAQPYFAY